MASETIEDIVREMREQANTWMDRKVPNFCELHDHWMMTADRIEAADAGHCDGCKLLVEDVRLINTLKAENARLRAALKPVLECDCWILETGKSRATDGGVSAIKAVRDAKRIYNESNNGESHN